MRYGIISDIHGNLEALESALGALSRERIDKFICVGDIVGYGANPRECIEKTKALDPVIVCGNHDAASSGLTDTANFNEAARDAVRWTRENISDEDVLYLKGLHLVAKDKYFMLVHGTLEKPDEFHYMLDRRTVHKTFELMDMKICFVGHTHTPSVFSCRGTRVDYFCKEKIKVSKEERLIVNAGSVGQPRDGDPRLCYFVYDSDTSLLALKRLPYDIEKAQKKILKAGLPPYLARRLKTGM